MIYYLLSKEDFASLYKFGEVNVKVGAAAESEDPRDAVKRLFSASDSFEYAQERLIVSSEKGIPGTVRMVDVKDIFPLDGISRNVFQSQFNTALVFREPVFQDIAEDFLKNTVLERTTVSGINALRAVFALEPEKDDEMIAEIIKGKAFLRRYKYFDVPFEDRTPYSMLIAYNRYQHYPKDNRGFFYDAADCFMYGSMYSALTGKGIDLIGYDRDLVANLCRSFFEFLESIPSNTQFTRLAGLVEDSNPKIGEAIAPVYGSIRFLALYFYVKEQIRHEDTVSMNGLSLLNSIRKKYPEDFPRLLTLLGGFFGYTWVYDRLYEFQDSPFLSIHHSLDDLQPKETAVQAETAPAPLTEEPASVTAEQHEPLPDGAQEDTEVQPVVTQPEEPFPEAQPDTTEPVVPKEDTQQEAIKPVTEPTLPREEDVQGEPETLMPQPDTEQPPVDVPRPALDVPNIVRVVLNRCSVARQSAFKANLKERYDTVLQLALEKDVEGLQGIYPLLDPKFDFKNAKDHERMESFAKMSMVIIYSMN